MLGSSLSIPLEESLPEVTEDLAEFAWQKLRMSGVEVILDTRLVGSNC